MSTAIGTPVFKTVGGDASAATATYTPSGATATATDTLATVALNANAAAADATAAKSESSSASSAAASALTVANAAIPASKINVPSGVLGVDAGGSVTIPDGLAYGATATVAVGNHYGNQTAAVGSIYEWIFLTGSGSPDVTVQYWGGTSGTAGTGNISYTAATLAPSATNTTSLGTASLAWSGIVSQNAVQVISDSNDKNIIGTIGDGAYTDQTTKLRAAWAAISGVVYTLKASTNTDPRSHVGVIAQTVEAAFTAQGLDPSDWGLWCSTPKTKLVTTTTEDAATGKSFTTTTEEPVYEADGKTQATQQTIRYEELLSLGIFCERLERADLAARVTALETKSTTPPAA